MAASTTSWPSFTRSGAGTPPRAVLGRPGTLVGRGPPYGIIRDHFLTSPAAPARGPPGAPHGLFHFERLCAGCSAGCGAESADVVPAAGHPVRHLLFHADPAADEARQGAEVDDHGAREGRRGADQRRH